MTTQVEIVVRDLPLARLHQVDKGVVTLRCGTGALNIVAGRNGSGKTTLLDILAMRRPLGRKGQIIRSGHSTWSDIAYLPQHVLGIGDITVHGAMRLAARRDADLSVVKRFMKEAAIPIGSKLGALSGGEGQFFCFALVAAQSTPVYIYDEPFRHLDDSRAQQVSDYLGTQVTSDALVIVTDNEGQFPRSHISARVVIDLDLRQPAPPGPVLEVTCA